eukprot:scaffold156109_cov35-Tisochrysis_lutea.AAC.4
MKGKFKTRVDEAHSFCSLAGAFPSSIWTKGDHPVNDDGSRVLGPRPDCRVALEPGTEGKLHHLLPTTQPSMLFNIPKLIPYGRGRGVATFVQDGAAGEHILRL